MRYQSRTFRSQSYLNNYNKENKENQNILNLKQNKPLKTRHNESLLPKLDKKISQAQTDATTLKPLLKDQNLPLDLKSQYSKLTGEQYSQDILTHLCSQSSHAQNFLQNHGITAHLRSKMVDWMIQVLSSYKMHEDTFFRSVKLMDIFLKKTTIRQQIKDLHLIGVASMFSACKYEEIYPFKLQTMYDRIARKKFKRTQILQKQSQILAALNFRLEQVNLYDIVKNTTFQIHLKIDEDQKNYLDQIVLYLSKMSLFSYDLAQEDTKLLAAAVYFIALKTLEQVEPALKPEERLTQIAVLLDTSDDKIIEVSRKVLDLAKNFSTVYPNLGNLKKFNKFQYKKKSKNTA